MQVKLLVSRVGPMGAQDRGAVVDVSHDEAVRMIDAGQAEPLRTSKKAEKAVKRSKAERATR